MPSILTSCEIKSSPHLTLATEKLLLWRAMEAVTMGVFTLFSLLLLFWVAQQNLQWRAVYKISISVVKMIFSKPVSF
jgi:hypothetical protein